MRRITTLATAACLLAIPAMAQPAGNDRLATAAQLRDAALAGNKAWGLLSNLTDTVGQRLAGTEAEARGRAWAKAEMQKLGLVNIREEAFPLTLWERGQASATIVGSNHQLALAALGTSGATPAGGITAPVTCFSNLAAFRAAPDAAVKGRIIFVDHRMGVTQDGSSYGVNGAVRRAAPAAPCSRPAPHRSRRWRWRCPMPNCWRAAALRGRCKCSLFPRPAASRASPPT